MNNDIIICYASWQHKLKTYIHKITAGNDDKKQALTYTCNRAQNNKHSAKLLHAADLMYTLHIHKYDVIHKTGNT